MYRIIRTTALYRLFKNSKQNENNIIGTGFVKVKVWNDMKNLFLLHVINNAADQAHRL